MKLSCNNVLVLEDSHHIDHRLDQQVAPASDTTIELTPELAFIIPAHNEAPTVAGVVEACSSASELLGVSRSITVVSDSSADNTDQIAREAGADVIVRKGKPSKALALTEGVRGTRAPWLFFVDADCVGIGGGHLATIAEPALRGDASMSVGVFDYTRYFNPVVQRFPWSTGQRILPRSLYPTEDPRLDAYNVEVIINEAIGRIGGITTSFVMEGVTQRSKVRKTSLIAGLAANITMWRDIARTSQTLDADSYSEYMSRVKVCDSVEARPITPLESRLGFLALAISARLAARL